jgi:NAD(P)-dependent dehydrogenase (short-subunit alcohol dehydrogenase family)
MTTLVTGATGAFGSVLVKTLAARGERVIAVVRPGSKAEGFANEPGVVVKAIDLLSRDSWKKSLAELAADGLVPDGAVLSAGNWKGGERLHESSDDRVWRAMIENNLETAHTSLVSLLPGMVERRRGSIVLIGSRAAERPWESAGASAYAAAKAAVVALARVAAQEVLAEGVRVNVVLPSVIDTPPNRAAMPDADHARWVSPESLAQTIAFLLSDAARDVTGSVLPVYGRAGV